MKVDLARRYPPGDLAIWIFILAELAVFAAFFAAYAFTRMGNVELFDTYQQTLDRNAVRTRNTQRAWPRPCTLVYLVMIGLTLVSFGIGVAGLSGLKASLTVLAFALIKGQMLGDYFMGLKGLRSPWRAVILLWLLIPGALIATAFTLAD